ncbi:MAG: hypothetical protein ACREUV_10795 [Burkholderiales bacterium]
MYDVEDVELIIDAAEATSEREKIKLKADLRKRIDGGFVDPHELPAMYQWYVVNARLAQHKYSDWTGWHFRSEWSEAISYGNCKLPKWNGEFWPPVGDGEAPVLLVLGEQGLGDEVMFLSLMPEVLVRVGRNVVYEGDPRLTGLVSRAFGIPMRGRLPLNTPRDRVSAFVPLAGLAPMFRRERKHFPGKPYFRALPELIERWMPIVSGMTGLSWRGRTGSCMPEELMLPGTVYCNLQYDAAPEEVPPGVFTPDIDLREDVENVCAILMCLTGAVCVPVSVSHFAGALGVPCDVVIQPRKSGSIDPMFNWRFGLDGRCDWHRSVRVWPNIEIYRREYGADLAEISRTEPQAARI